MWHSSVGNDQSRRFPRLLYWRWSTNHRSTLLPARSQRDCCLRESAVGRNWCSMTSVLARKIHRCYIMHVNFVIELRRLWYVCLEISVQGYQDMLEREEREEKGRSAYLWLWSYRNVLWEDVDVGRVSNRSWEERRAFDLYPAPFRTNIGKILIPNRRQHARSPSLQCCLGEVHGFQPRHWPTFTPAT